MTPLTKVTRRTVGALDGTFCRDRGKRLIVTLEATATDDLIILRPERNRCGVVKLSLADVYRYGLRCQANAAVLEKARHKKEVRQRQREARALKYAEKKLLKPI